MITVSRHAYKRIKQRLGLPRKAVNRLVHESWEKGIRHNQVIGSLRKYLDSLYFENEKPFHIRIYKEKVFLFSKDCVLITILNLPNKFKKVSHGIYLRKAHGVA